MRLIWIVLACGACGDKGAPPPAAAPPSPPKPALKGMPQPPSPVEEIAIGMDAVAVRLADGSTWTWGQQGDTEPYLVKFPMRIPLDGAHGLGGGSMTNGFCGVRDDGTAVCAEHSFDKDRNVWTWNESKQWGRPPATDGLEHVHAISPSYVFDCAILDDGTARCWGEFRDHPKEKDASAHYEPVPIRGVAHATAVSVGGSEACVVLADHRVACWGRTDAGEEHPAAHVIPKLDHVTQLASGGAHHCVLRDDATVSCWGMGMDGQVGQGARLSLAEPTLVPGVREVVDLRCGQDACCVRHRDATVTCWGNDITSREVGPSHAKRPEKVPGITDAKLLAVGDHDACVVRTSGVISCWGDAETAVLGEATTTELTDIRWLPR